jgi:hypothetical protein
MNTETLEPQMNLRLERFYLKHLGVDQWVSMFCGVALVSAIEIFLLHALLTPINLWLAWGATIFSICSVIWLKGYFDAFGTTACVRR